MGKHHLMDATIQWLIDARNAFVVFTAFHLVYIIIPFLMVAVPVYLIFLGYWWIAAIFAGTYCFMTFDGSERRPQGRPWEWFVEHPIWKWLSDYFPAELRYVGQTKLDPQKVYIFAVHPHGPLAFNRGIFCLNRNIRWRKVFPGIVTRDLAATASLRTPFIREAFLWTGCVDAGRETAERVLEAGYSLLVYPGGEHEQVEAKHGVELAWIKHRKGFVRLALRYGAPIIPVYVFGESKVYRTLPLLLGLRRWLVRRFRVGLPACIGRYGTLLPFKHKLTAVASEPITVDKVDNPTDSQVDELHAQYMRRLVELFDAHKKELGAASSELVLM